VLEPVLVLNANFEPINICSTRRAMGLLLTGKADMVVNGSRLHPHDQRVVAASFGHSAGVPDTSSAAARQIDAPRSVPPG